MINRQFFLILSLILAALLLAACTVPLPVAIAPPPTPTPLPSATPTFTPLPTPTPSPTSTPLPSPTVTVVPLVPTPTLVPLSLEEREALFAQIWQLVRDRYVYEDYGGLDWEQVRAEFAPRIAAAESADEFYSLMRLLIERLGDDHSRFASPQEVADEEARFAGSLAYGGIGATVRSLPEGGLITGLARGGPAEVAGLQVRDLITRVEGIAFSDSAAFGPRGPIGAVQGPPGTPVVLTVRSNHGQEREVTVIRARIDSEAFVQVEATRLPDNIGLLRIDTFHVEGLVEEVRTALEGLVAEGPVVGLVIDLRANSGGRVDMMLSTLGLLIDGGTIGSSSGRASNDELVIPSGTVLPQFNNLPVAVLIGPDTVSAAEMFAAGIQYRGRAQVVGLPSAGNTESMRPHEFASGARLWLAELAYQLPDGTLIEGRGVQPDQLVEAEWWRYAPLDDPQVLAARTLLLAQAPPS